MTILSVHLPGESDDKSGLLYHYLTNGRIYDPLRKL